MKILIIGNGFDLNLGLKTSYKDFIESNQFKELVKDKNLMALYFNEKQEINNWVDIERELTDFSNSIKDANLNIKDDFKNLKIALSNYIEEAQNKEINTYSKAFKILKNEITEIDIIINFNYTNSIFRIADILNINDVEDKHKYVHGSIKNKDIIFGVEDNAQVQLHHKFFKKSYNKNHGEHNIERIMENPRVNEIIIFGHSLGITDSTYFKSYISERVVRLQNVEKLIFHYYGESGWDDMYKILDQYTRNSMTKFKMNNFFPIDSSI